MNAYTNQNFTYVQNYFRTLAELYQPIGHTDNNPKFFTDLQEVLLSKTLNGKIMLCLREPSPVRNTGDNWMRNYTCTIIIVKNVSKEAFDAQEAVFNETENDLYEIIARVKKDCDQVPVAQRPFADYQKNEIPMDFIIPTGADLWCGMKMKLTVLITIPRINAITDAVWSPQS